MDRRGPYRFSSLATTGFVLLAIVAQGRTPKGDQAVEQAHQAESQNTTAGMDRALALARQAAASDPSDVGYQLEVARLRAYCAQFHVNDGNALLRSGMLREALAEFERAAEIDPAPSVALQEANRLKAALGRGDGVAELAPAVTRASRGAEKTFASAKEPPKLAVRPTKPIPVLRVNRQPSSEVFVLLGSLLGVRVLFDPEYRGQSLGANQTLDFSGLTVEEAFDHLALISKSFWRPLSKESILVANDEPAKRAAFDEQVTRVFYLTNVQGSQTAASALADTVQKVTDIKKLQFHQDQNAIVVRADRNRTELAAKLMHDLDKQKSELIIDVLILSVSKDWIRDLGTTLRITGDTTNVIATPRPSVGAGGNPPRFPLNALKRLQTGDFGITLPGVALSALLETRGTKILDKAQLRTLEGQKSTLKIGQRIPYATGSFTPGAVGGMNALVNTQFQFFDVGLSLDVMATVHEPDEVSLHIDSDHSSVADYVNLGGVLQPLIAQRRRTADVRVKEGEVNFWDIVSQKISLDHTTGVPGLNRVPVLGRIFRGERREETEDQLLHLLIPHIVRKPDLTDVNLAPLASGSDQAVRITYASSAAEIIQSSKETLEVASTLPPPAAPATAGDAVGMVAFQPAAIAVKAGRTFKFDIVGSGLKDLTAITLNLSVNEADASCKSFQVGALLSAGGAKPEVVSDAGPTSAMMRIERATATAGPDGVLASVECTAKRAGFAPIALDAASWTNSAKQESSTPPARLAVTIEP